MTTHVYGRNAGQFLNVRTHLLSAESAVDAGRQKFRVRYGIPKCFDGLPRKGTSTVVGNRYGDHDRNPPSRIRKIVFESEQRRLDVDRVENRFRKKKVHAAVQIGRASCRERVQIEGGD